MNTDLKSYVHHYKNFLDKKLCNQTVKELKKIKTNNWREHTFYNRATNQEEKLSGNHELSTIYTEEISTIKPVMDLYWKAIHKYFDYYKFPWWDTWTGYSLIRFNKYSK